ncbi:hypothetical protein [Pararhizobium gei]|uniref:hypothetical protein n=1 Tax=Pararhizobium gei TaxID=1395951 RepID=UPI0023DB003D|nr:hypothetical protein [Rhizobium gei]
MSARTAKCVSEGYALCDPNGRLAPLSFRGTRTESITALFALEDWAGKESEGWSAEIVYARIFTPKFFVDVIPEEKAVA